MSTEARDIIAREVFGDDHRTSAWELITDVDRALYHQTAGRYLAALAAAGYAVVKLPTIPFKGPYDTDASMLHTAADKAESARYPVGGSNVGRAVADILRQAAAAAEAEK